MKTFVRSALSILLLASLAVGLDAQMRAGKLGIGVGGSMYKYSGEYTAANKMGGGLSITYSPWKAIGFRSLVGIGQMGYTVKAGTNANAPLGGPATTTFATANLYLTGNLMPNSKFNPYISGGVGYIYFDPRLDDGTALTGAGLARNDFNFFAGGGFDVFFSEFVSISLGGELCFSNTDRFDGYKAGSATDSYMRVGVDLRYYFFDQGFLTRMLEALKARYE